MATGGEHTPVSSPTRSHDDDKNGETESPAQRYNYMNPTLSKMQRSPGIHEDESVTCYKQYMQVGTDAGLTGKDLLAFANECEGGGER